MAMAVRKQSRLPAAHTEETLHKAADRVGSGMGGSLGRFDGMTLGGAQAILRDGITELLALRSERRELVCTKCMAIYLREHIHGGNVAYTALHSSQCPKCDGLLRPKSLVMEAALREKVETLEERIAHLQESLTAVLDLGVEDQPESEDLSE